MMRFSSLRPCSMVLVLLGLLLLLLLEHCQGSSINKDDLTAMIRTTSSTSSPRRRALFNVTGALIRVPPSSPHGGGGGGSGEDRHDANSSGDADEEEKYKRPWGYSSGRFGSGTGYTSGSGLERSLSGGNGSLGTGDDCCIACGANVDQGSQCCKPYDIRKRCKKLIDSHDGPGQKGQDESEDSSEEEIPSIVGSNGIVIRLSLALPSNTTPDLILYSTGRPLEDLLSDALAVQYRTQPQHYRPRILSRGIPPPPSSSTAPSPQPPSSLSSSSTATHKEVLLLRTHTERTVAGCSTPNTMPSVSEDGPIRLYEWHTFQFHFDCWDDYGRPIVDESLRRDIHLEAQQLIDKMVDSGQLLALMQMEHPQISSLAKSGDEPVVPGYRTCLDLQKMLDSTRDMTSVVIGGALLLCSTFLFGGSIILASMFRRTRLRKQKIWTDYYIGNEEGVQMFLEVSGGEAPVKEGSMLMGGYEDGKKDAPFSNTSKTDPTVAPSSSEGTPPSNHNSTSLDDLVHS